MSLLDKQWKVVDPSQMKQIEGISIFTVDNEEVVGCSEWMRVDDGIFEHIVKLHNEWLGGAE